MFFGTVFSLLSLSVSGSFVGNEDGPLVDSVQISFSPAGSAEVLGLCRVSRNRKGVIALVGLNRKTDDPVAALMEGEVLGVSEVSLEACSNPRWQLPKVDFPFLGMIELSPDGGVGLPFVVPIPSDQAINQTAPPPLSQRNTGPVDLVIAQMSTEMHAMTSVCDGFDPLLPDMSCHPTGGRHITLFARIQNLGTGTVPANTTDVLWKWESYNQPGLPGTGNQSCVGSFPNANSQVIGLAIPAGGTFISARGFYQGPCDPGCNGVPAQWRRVTCFTTVVDSLGTIPETNENNGFAGLPLQLCDYCGHSSGSGGGVMLGKLEHDP